MFSFFSLSTPRGNSSGPNAIDLQLLSDEEVLKIWQQSQTIAAMLEEKDMPSHIAQHYTQAIEQELQFRSQLQPNIFFNATCEQEIKEAQIAPNNTLATNIII